LLSFNHHQSRSGPRLTHSLLVLDGLWEELRSSLQGDGLQSVRAREAAALTATARWCTTAAKVREESRGLHQREDIPGTDERFARRLVAGGLDQVRTRWEEPARSRELEAS